MNPSNSSPESPAKEQPMEFEKTCLTCKTRWTAPVLDCPHCGGTSWTGPDFNAEVNLHADTVAERHDAAKEQLGEALMPKDFIIGALHFHAGVKVETVQDAVNRLYEHMRGLECELGYLCWKCKSAIYPGQPRHAFNVAPSAASVYVHETCPADPLKAFQERIAPPPPERP